MWSMSKIVVLVALLRSMGWGEDPGKPLKGELADAVDGAIRRSENCRQRRVVLELQDRVGGPRQAELTLQRVLDDAGAEATVVNDVEPPTEPCIAYLSGQSEISDPLGDALLVGVSTWTVKGAARFVAAVDQGVYGEALGDEVWDLMAEPKKPSREAAPGTLTFDNDWGAGKVFGAGKAAYKAGWGGAEQGDFLAGQIVMVHTAGEDLDLAVMAHPARQPVRDDPGVTRAPTEIEAVLRAAGETLAR
jgi:hypothetical protein